MNVPLLDLKAQYRTIRDEVRAVMDEVCDAQYFIMGPKVEEFEKAVAAYSGAKFGVGVSSGTDALLIALMVLAVAFYSTRPKFLLPLASALNLSSVRFLSPSLSLIIVAGGVAVGCIAGLVASRRV